MIRLLKYSDATGEIELQDFPDDQNPSSIPRYAILSHTWGDQEVTFPELKAGTGKDKAGYEKIRFCVEQAAKDGIEYSWVDTCCIDKSQSDELQSAIFSMFRWYKRAAKCYVFLSDVSVPANVSNPAESEDDDWIDAFEQSRWFTRGWTLQELLAPRNVEFYSKEGKLLGTKISLEEEILEVTTLPKKALRARRLSVFTIDERFRWVRFRRTTKPEDRAYCLFGIFGVVMPLLYGEGEENALRRLRAEIAQEEPSKPLAHGNRSSGPATIWNTKNSNIVNQGYQTFNSPQNNHN